MKRYQIGSAKPEATPNYTWSPAREPSPASDVSTPAGQAAIIGLVSGLLYLAIRIKIGANIWDTLINASIIALAVMLMVFVWRMLWSGSTLHRIEEWTGTDLDGDGEIGLPHAAIRNAAQRRTADDMAVRAATLARLAYNGNSDIRSIQGRMPGISDREYGVLRDALISASLAKWRGVGHSHGWEIDKSIPLEELLRQVDERIVWSDAPQK